MYAKWLLIDADDTLWENSVYFEQAFDEFVALLDHSHLSPEQVRVVLDEIELEAIRAHGYGTLNFGRNLRNCYETLAETPVSEEDLDRAVGLAHRILDRPIELIEGVAETLEYLNSRYHLTLFSKGQHDEQHAKVDRSGVKQYFHACRIVPEKHAEAYRQIVAEERMDAGQAWMVGNSPKSDINPALEAGLGAVFVPHAMTWSLEHEGLPAAADRFHVIDGFSDLRKIF
jgi:putative hydrolase of the HAD superfamily